MAKSSLNPVRAIERSFDHPNLGLAFLFVLLPTIVSIIGIIVFSLKVNAVSIIISAIVSVVSWIVLGIVLYLIGFVIEGNSLKGRLQGIFAALSLLWIVPAILLIVEMIVFFSMPPGIMQELNALQSRQISTSEDYGKIAELINASAESSSLLIIGLFAAFVIALVALVVLVFLIAREMSPKSTGKQIAITIIFIVAWIIISGFTSTIGV